MFGSIRLRACGKILEKIPILTLHQILDPLLHLQKDSAYVWMS